ncbi:MAG: NHL repeat-containing protein [Isosphaeraceae bacterium]
MLAPFLAHRRARLTPPPRRHRRPQLEAMEGRVLLTAGALDTTFGGTGTVVTNATTVTASNDQTQYASGTVVLPDLTTVVAGVTPEAYQTGKGANSVSTHLDIVLARYNPDGSLDQAFGSGGLVRIRAAVDYWGSNLEPHLISVALQTVNGNPEIVVAGDTTVTYSTGKHGTVTRHDLYVARLNLNGSFDTTFNNTGSETIDFPQGDVFAEGVAVQSDGKIVVGADSGAAGLHFLAVRLDANGGLDSSFGPNGQGYVGLASGSAQDMILDGSGNILVCGYDNNPSTGSSTMAVVRYTPSGQPDPTFGNNGEALVTLGAPYAYAIGVQSTGQIVVSGDFPSGGGVARLNANGSVDTSFGSGGAFTDATMFVPMALTVQPNDEILVAGKGPHGGSPFGFFIDRLQAGGLSDATFGVNGQAQAYFSGMTDAEPHAMILGPDGKITVTGDVNYYQGGVYWNRLGTARFLNDITSNTTASSPATATTAPALLAASPVAPASGVSGLALAPLVLDSPDLQDFLHPLSRRWGKP